MSFFIHILKLFLRFDLLGFGKPEFLHGEISCLHGKNRPFPRPIDFLALCRQFLSTLLASSLEDRAPCQSSHSAAEAVRSFSSQIVRLECAFHVDYLLHPILINLCRIQLIAAKIIQETQDRVKQKLRNKAIFVFIPLYFCFMAFFLFSVSHHFPLWITP